MISLLVLPILTFVDAGRNENSGISGRATASWRNFGDSRFNSRKHSRSRTSFVREIRVLNGSKLLIECTPAEYLVRTHMAPDFESPQLVRRLDWFHDSALIASYQQDAISGISEEWWVGSMRHELRRPFYQLRVSPVLASDSGEYKCVLETDPLFTLDQSVMSVRLMVTVKPPAPSKPLISGADQNYIGQEHKSFGGGGLVLVSWNHSTGAAHRPILRYSVLISRVDDSSNIRVLTTDSNRTSRIVDGLLPNVQYAFSVRAENAAGESEFGPEAVFSTRVSAPKSSPKIVSIRNQTGSDSNSACVEVEWTFDDPVEPQLVEIIGYRITAIELLNSLSSQLTTSHRAREWHVKRAEKRADAVLCSLEFGGEFQLKIEADTSFGSSPPAVTTFRTAESIPDGPPLMVSVRVDFNGIFVVRWEEPARPNGRITSYQIYLKEKHRSAPPMLIRLLVRPEDTSKTFVYNITDIVPNLSYEIQLSASTAKGEGIKSRPIVVKNEQIDSSPPRIVSINYDCTPQSTGHNSVIIEWVNVAKKVLGSRRTPSSVAENKTMFQPRDMEYFYRVEFEDTNRKFSLNATSNFVKIDNLEQNRRHSVAVVALFRPSPEDSSFRETAPSKTEFFKIDEETCNIHSSICSSSNNNCKEIMANAVSIERDFVSVFLILLGVLSTTFFSVVFTIFLKRHCSVFSMFVYHKKKKCEIKKLQKSNGMFRRESLSLINDSLLLDVSEATFGQTISASAFEIYVAELSANNNSGFRKQFQELTDESPRTDKSSTPDVPSVESIASPFDETARSCTTEESQQNSKNRYVNVLATEHSRIRINRSSNSSSTQSNADNNNVLSQLSNDDGYINANYVDSCDEKNVYIATQAPLPHTFADFWAMIWQENCSVIVMITNLIEDGKRKCDQYWPSSPQLPIQFETEQGVAEFEVVLNAENVNSVFTHRVFTLVHFTDNADNSAKHAKISTLGRKRESRNKSQRIVHQLQFTLWPDHGVPDTVFPLLHFMNCVAECHIGCQNSNLTNKASKSSSQNLAAGPIVVHCSAGVGRSGSFILIDSMRRHLLRCDRINIQAHLRRMRRQRARLVQTLEQYIFCHKVLCNLIHHGVSRQSAASFSGYLHYLLSEFLPTTILHNGGEQTCVRPQSYMQRQFEDVCKCTHNPACRNESSTERIITLPGYYRADEFLVANWPSECADFWAAVWRKRCSLILLLGSNAEVGDFFRTTQSSKSTGALWNISESKFGDSKSIVSDLITNSENSLHQNGMRTSIALSKNLANILYTSHIPTDNSNEMIIRLKRDDCTFDIKILMVRPSVLETNVWNEIECIQDQLLQCGETIVTSQSIYTCVQQPMMLLNPRSVNGSMPFILCALQSAACQLEAEGSLDVLLYLAWYKHISCGCWSTQGNIEYIYAKLMELIHLKEIRV